MENQSLKTIDILNEISTFAIQTNIPNIIKGKVKRNLTYQKTLTQNEVIDNEFSIEFTSNIEKDHFLKICLFNERIVNYCENKKIKYKFLQYKYKKNDDFTPIQNVYSIHDNLPCIIQKERNYLFLMVCEINLFQPNSNLEYLKTKFIEISSSLKVKNNIDFKVIFFESISKHTFSNQFFYKKFGDNYNFQEKVKYFVMDNYLNNISFYYIPKISSNNLMKSTLEFYLEKDKLPFLMIIDTNNKLLYEGLFHIIDINKTFEYFEKNNTNIVFHSTQNLSYLEMELEDFKKLSNEKFNQNLEKDEYKAIKKILCSDFKQKISNITFNFPYSYITETFCLEKQYNFENKLCIKIYKKPLINYFFSKTMKQYYIVLKNMLSNLKLTNKVLDFSTSDSKKIILNNPILFFSSFFKDKTIKFQTTIKSRNDYQIINNTPLIEFEKESNKLSKVYYLMNLYYMTSPLVKFYNFFPCLKIGDYYMPIKYLQKVGDHKELFTLELLDKLCPKIIIFISHNIYRSKELYETKLYKLKEIFNKNEFLFKKCYITIIYFNTINDMGFSEKNKHELMNQFLALTSPFKYFDFFFLDSLKNYLASMQYMIYFSKLNTIKALVINQDNKITYNDNF